MAVHPFPELRAKAGDRPLTLGFLTPHNALDRRCFSGTPYFAARALSGRADVDLRLLGAHRTPGRLDRILRRAHPEPQLSEAALGGLDAVVGMVATPLLDRLADLAPGLPFLHVTDATPRFLRDAYGWSVPAEADATEARVAARAAACVYSSEVLAARAPGDLGLPGLNAVSLPFGANFEAAPAPAPKPPLDRLELLFVGLDWVRKGGDVAVATLDALIASGRDARLTLVGACPDRHRRHPAIRRIGFLDKNRPKEADRLSRLFAEAHLLLLPSRADCTPIVVSEAMAHGTPVLASDTGGIGAQIGAAGAGRLMPSFAPPAAWAAAVRKMTSDPDGYAMLCDAARDRAATHLSWDAWAAGIVRLVLERDRSRPAAAPRIRRHAT